MKPPKKGDHVIGYGRPPPNQWKKGQTGNPRRKRPPETESDFEMILRQLMARTTLTGKGQRSMTNLEAMAHRVSNLEILGNPRAAKLRIRMENLDRAGPSGGAEIKFEESGYSRNLTILTEDQDK